MASKLTLDSKLKLSDGTLIPRLGLGVYEMSNEQATRAVTWALEAEDVFYCSKLQNNAGYSATQRSINASLQKCGLEYIDLYLIHSPYGGKKRRLESWKAIEEAKDQGLIKSVGVSNYGQRHIEELLASSPKHRPTVNQCDLHPFMARAELVEYCRGEGIEMECWGPLVRGERFDHPVLQKIAKKHGKTPAQVLVRWSLQRGYVTIPKSVSKDRIKENADVYDFELDDKEVEELLKLDEYLVTDWDPIGDSSV
uniref:NADP-dependent oxidoreductase domain-containing protein n=1 Tax=Kalmanozyma brasiliensis (strain GHG001) TaxID=1365824 RepID=V5ETH7_KALBG